MAGNLARRNDLRIGRGFALKLITLLGTLFLIAPLLVIVVFSFNTGRSLSAWEGFGTQWYSTVLHDQSLWTAVRNSIFIAVLSTLITTTISTLFALAVGLRRFRGRNLLLNFLHVPIVLPEVIFGISLLAFFVLAHFPLGLVSITFAHVTFSIPFVTLVVLARVEHFDRNLESASFDLGAGWWRTFRLVILPNIAPGVISGALLAFTLSIDDFVVTFFVAGPGSSTLPLKIYSLVKFGVTPALNALSTLLIFATVSAILLIASIRKAGRFKRALTIVSTAAATGLIVVAACTALVNDEEKVLHIYNFSDYMDESLLEDFERETGIHVTMDFYNDNEEMLAKLKTGASGYDLIVPSSFMVAIMTRLDLLEPIDYRAVPNARGVDPFFSKLPYDSGSVHSVPYAFGVCGIMYNTEFVHDSVTSWGALWDKRYAGKILMVDDMRTTFLPAFALEHAQMRDRNQEALRRAKERLIEQKPLVKKYESNTIMDFLLNREVWIAQIWNGFAVRLAREHSEFRFALPCEQTIFFVDNLAVPRSSIHKDAAFRFIDFILRPENAARNMRKILYGMPYPAARAMLEPELRNSPIMFPTAPPGGAIDVPDDLGEFNESLERAWMEVKSR